MIQDRVKLPLKFDPSLMKRDLESLAQVSWINHFVTQNYEGDWSVIPLRGPTGAEHPVMMIYSDPSCSNFSDTPFLKVCPYFSQVLSQFHCSLYSVRLMKLTSGSNIKEHSDNDLSLEDGFVRLHIPVVTHPELIFTLNQKRVQMSEGECWYLRLSDPHSVSNQTPVDRVHLVIDAKVNNWLRDLCSGN